MQAVFYEAFGGADVLKLGELARPEPAPGEVLIRIHATSVNPIDWKIRQGLFECVFDHAFPVIPGWDAAGEIAALGPGVDEFSIGDAVYAYCRKAVAHDGTYADYIAMPAAAVAPKPEGLSFQEAAAIPLCGLTAWQSLKAFAGLRPGQTVLIHAGAGGVGSLAIPIARHLGAKVLTTCSAQNRDYCAGLGADHVIDYRAGDYREAVRALAPDGLDMVFDCVGGAIPDESVDLIRPGGALACLNEAPDEAAAEARGIRASRIYAEPSGDGLRALTALVDAGVLRAPETRVFPLADARRAHELSEAGHVRGKLILTIANGEA